MHRQRDTYALANDFSVSREKANKKITSKPHPFIVSDKSINCDERLDSVVFVRSCRSMSMYKINISDDKEMDIGKNVDEEQQCVAMNVSPITAQHVHDDIKIGKIDFQKRLTVALHHIARMCPLKAAKRKNHHHNRNTAPSIQSCQAGHCCFTEFYRLISFQAYLLSMAERLLVCSQPKQTATLMRVSPCMRSA